MTRFTAFLATSCLLAISTSAWAQTTPPAAAPPGAAPPTTAPPGATPPSAPPPSTPPTTTAAPPADATGTGTPEPTQQATLEPSPLVAPPVEQPPPPAPEPQEEAPRRRDAGPFSKGNIGITIMAGTAVAGPRDYLLLGAGLGYYVVDGLELGVDGTIWLLEDPTIGTITPKATYVLHMVPVIKPYVGAFWRRYIINDYDDFSSIGARVGANLVMGRGGSYIGLGAVFEHLLDCNDTLRECDDVYPEITFAIAIGR